MDNKKADRIPVREKYEPVKVEVMEVASQGVLCASFRGFLKTYSGSAF